MNKYNILHTYISDKVSDKVYLIEINGKKFIMKKIPLIDKFTKNKPNFNMSVWREIDMSLFINNLPKEKIKFFMKMIDYKEVKCKGIFQEFDLKSKAFVTKKTNKCLEIIYEYKGDTLNNLLLEQNMKLKEKYNMISQIIYALDIIKKEGYVHNDVHSGNITYDKVNSTYSLIDYGSNKHQKYNLGITKEYLSINPDLIYFVRQVILQKSLLDGNIDMHSDFEPKFKMEDILEIFNNHKKIWNKIKNTLSKKGNNYIKWFETFESGKINKFYKNYDEDYPEMKSNGKNIINVSIIEEIKILFSAYDRKNWLKLYKYKVNIPNLIPTKDIEYIILNIKNNKKIMRYFISHL